MLCTYKKLKHLKEQVDEARYNIHELFFNEAYSPEKNRFAWGQFLDEPRNRKQAGIYGTSSGLQVLVSYDHRSSSTKIIGAINYLKDAIDNDDKNNVFRNKGDLNLIYKLTYIADAIQPCNTEINNDYLIYVTDTTRFCSNEIKDVCSRCRPFIYIINNMQVGGGWTDNYIPEPEKNIQPSIIATATALLTLRRYQPFLLMDKCKTSIRWLNGKVKIKKEKMRTFELALTTLVFINYEFIIAKNRINNGEDKKLESDYKLVKEICLKEIYKRVKSRKKYFYFTTEVYSFSTGQCDQGVKHLFFLSDCLLALACLNLKQEIPYFIQRYIQRTIRYYTTQIIKESKKGFAPYTTDRISTVDHLWIYRLLDKFKSVNKEPAIFLLPQLSFNKVLFLLFFLIIVIVGLYIEKTTNVSIKPLYKIVGGILSVIGLSLLSQTIWIFIKNRVNR